MSTLYWRINKPYFGERIAFPVYRFSESIMYFFLEESIENVMRLDQNRREIHPRGTNIYVYYFLESMSYTFLGLYVQLQGFDV